MIAPPIIPVFSFLRKIMSCPLVACCAKEPARQEDEHEHEDTKGHDGLKLVRGGNIGASQKQVRADRLKDPQYQSAGGSSADAADSSENGGGEGFQAGNEPHEEDDLIKH